jgi:hypothetical protein
MTDAQRAYIERCVWFLRDSVESATADVDVVPPLDKIADDVNAEIDGDAIDLSEVKQQTDWECAKCETRTDILGHYGNCSVCGYRNNLLLLRKSLDDIRSRAVEGSKDRQSDLLKLATSELDGFARDLASPRTHQACQDDAEAENASRKDPLS